MRRKIILASTSKYRRALLDGIGLDYVAQPPRFDEQPVPGWSARETAMRFAIAKAESLRAEHPDALILGSDQTVGLDERIFGKPGSKEGAVAQLMELSGRTHRLYTAVALIDTARAEEPAEPCLVTHEMKMRVLSREQIEAYVERDQPMDCAGAYKVESLGVLLFEEMRGPDHTAIVGLPLTAVSALFRAHGLELLTGLLSR